MAGSGVAGNEVTSASASRANLAAMLAAVAVAVWAVLVAIDADGPVWLAVGVLSAAAAITGWQARSVARALVAAVVGGLLFVMFVVFTIAEFA